MLADILEIIEPIHFILSPHGFKKRGKRSWYRNTDEILQNVHLDKSSYGPQNKIIFYFGVSRFQKVERPNAEIFSMNYRFGNTVSNKELLKAALDQENAVLSKVERFNIISDNLSSYGVPILQQLVTEEGAVNLFNKINDLNIFSIFKWEQEMLGINNK